MASHFNTEQLTLIATATIGLLSAAFGAFIGGLFALWTSSQTADKQHKFQAATYTFDYLREKQKSFKEGRKELGIALGIILGSTMNIEALTSDDSIDEYSNDLKMKKTVYECLSKTINLIIGFTSDVKYVKLLFEEFYMHNLCEYNDLKKYAQESNFTVNDIRNDNNEMNFDSLTKHCEKAFQVYSFLEICIELIITKQHKNLFSNWLPQLTKRL